MSEAVLTVVISSAFALVASWGTVLVMLRKAPSEINKNNADASEGNAKAAVTLNEGLVKRVEKVEGELAEACIQVESMQIEIRELRNENSLLRDWADRLTHQVISLRGIPVSMVETKPIKKEGSHDS